LKKKSLVRGMKEINGHCQYEQGGDGALKQKYECAHGLMCFR